MGAGVPAGISAALEVSSPEDLLTTIGSLESADRQKMLGALGAPSQSEVSSPTPGDAGPRRPTMARTSVPGGRKKVAVYGGAFDPITNSHLTCASQIVHSRCADEVWIVPCGPRPDKPGLKTSPVDRYCMCQIAVNTTFSPSFPVHVSDIECFKDRALFTYDQLNALAKEYPENDFCFVIGSDWLMPGTNMAEWTSVNHDWNAGDPEEDKFIVTGHKMLAEFDFLVIPRPGYDVEPTPDDATGLKQFGPRLSWLVMPDDMRFIEGNLSSSAIRKRAAHSWQVRDEIRKGSGEFNSANPGGTLLDVEGLLPLGVMAYIRRRRLFTGT